MDNSGFGRHRNSNSVRAPATKALPSVFIKRVISQTRSTSQHVHLLNFRWIDLPEATFHMSRLEPMDKKQLSLFWPLKKNESIGALIYM